MSDVLSGYVCGGRIAENGLVPNRAAMWLQHCSTRWNATVTRVNPMGKGLGRNTSAMADTFGRMHAHDGSITTFHEAFTRTFNDAVTRTARRFNPFRTRLYID